MDKLSWQLKPYSCSLHNNFKDELKHLHDLNPSIFRKADCSKKRQDYIFLSFPLFLGLGVFFFFFSMGEVVGVAVSDVLPTSNIRCYLQNLMNSPRNGIHDLCLRRCAIILTYYGWGYTRESLQW